MDFHRLARRELQTLCKKNRIPANMTNVAMADALKELEIVEGVQEFLQPCESETAQSSIESPVRSEVTTPHVPPTGGRSTRRRNVVKEEPETAKPMTRSRRTTQRTLVRDYDASQVDAIVTPAELVRTNRKKASMASAGRKMDSQLKECLEDEKKDTIVTPAPLGVMSRRRAAKEESAVKRVYSTRRSARLAEKNGTLLKELENENSCPLKEDLFTKDHENVEMNLTGNSDDLDAISGITGGDGNTNVEENSGKKDGVEVVSAQKQDTPLVSDGEMVSTGEDEIGNHVEADGSKLEVKKGSDVEIQEVGVDCEDEAEFNEQKCDKMEDAKDENVIMPRNVHNEVQDSDGFCDMPLVSEGEMLSTVEDKIGNHVEADGSKPEVKEGGGVQIQEVGFGCETEAELDKQNCEKAEDPKDENIVMPLNVRNEVQESDGFRDMSLVSEGELVSIVDDEIGNHVEADGSKLEVKEGSDVEIQAVGFGCETETEFDEQKCDETEDSMDENVIMPLNVHNEVQESDGPHNIYTSESKITVESKIMEVVSAQKQDVLIINKGEMVNSGDEETGNHFEADVSKPKVKESSDMETQDGGFGFETEAAMDEQKCDKIEDSKDENIIIPMSNELQESNGIHDVKTSETEITVEQKEELNIDKDAEHDGKSAEFIENIVLESEVEEASCDTDIPNEVEKEMHNGKGNGMDSEHVAVFYVNEEVPEMKEPMPDTLILVEAALSEIAADVHVNGSETEFDLEKSSELVTVEYKKESTDVVHQAIDDSLVEMPSDVISLMTEEDEAKTKLNVSKWNAVIAELIKKMDPTREKNETKLVKDTVESHEIGIIQHEENTKSADDVISDSKEESTDSIYRNTDNSDIDLVNEEDEGKMKLNIANWDAIIADLSDNQDLIGGKNEINLEKDTKEPHIGIFQDGESAKPADKVPSDTSNFLQMHPVQEQDLSLVKPTSLTPIKGPASKLSVTKKRMAASVSDNKENIGSGSKLVIAKERVKTAKKTAENIQSLDHLSVRKLAMMLKEKLTITNNESANGNENEQALARPALQALPENR